MTKLPTYEMVIDENPESDVEVSFVALVDKPAIEKNFMAFNGVKLEFSKDVQRQIVSGPAMVPDTLIYRRDAGGEYNVFFSKDTIERIALKFFKKDYQKNLNLFHDPNLSLQGVTIFESFVSDKARGIQPMKGFEDLPDGTWFISAKVDNPDVWAKIQSGEVRGFSVEGIFAYQKRPLSATLQNSSHIEEIDTMVKEFVARIKKELFDGTPLVTPAATPPATPPTTPQILNTDYQLKDGGAIQIDKLEVGGVAMMNGLPAPAGEMELADGTKITIGEGGVITLVTPAMAAQQQPALTMAEVEMAITKALSTYKEELAAEKLASEKAAGQFKAENEKRDKQIQALFELIEKLAELPTAEAVGDQQLSFSQEKAKSHSEKKEAFIKYITSKKSKTA